MPFDLICGLFGGYPVGDGRGAQQASADYFRRNQEAMLQTVGDGKADATAAMHAAFNVWPQSSKSSYPEWRARGTDSRYGAWRERMDAEAMTGPDWLYWGMLGFMAAACVLRFLFSNR